MSSHTILESLRDAFQNIPAEWLNTSVIRNTSKPDRRGRLFVAPGQGGALDHYEKLAFEAGSLLPEYCDSAKVAGVSDQTLSEANPAKRWTLALFDILAENVAAWGIDEASVFTHSAMAISHILESKPQTETGAIVRDRIIEHERDRTGVLQSPAKPAVQSIDRPTRPVSLTYAAEHWFNVDLRVLNARIKCGQVRVEQQSPKRWLFDLDEVVRLNPESDADADPALYKPKPANRRKKKTAKQC